MSLFGRPSLTRTSFLDGFKYARMFRGFFPIGVDHARYLQFVSPDKVIAHIEPLLSKEPKNWQLKYVLGDWYMRDRRYVDGLRVLSEAYRLRPKDPRSTYALATAYRVLARANLDGIDVASFFSPEYWSQLREADPQLYKLMWAGLSDYDPTASADELERLKMTVDEVAQRAMEYFEETLRLGVRKDEAKLVNDSLQSMYSEFPHLEMKVKTQRRTDTGIFGEARTGPGGLWNEAVDHFTRLRHLMAQPPRYRYELGEVIRLCQWAIANDPKLGDAHVLLANAYSLLDSQVVATTKQPYIYLRWSASILQHWCDTPLCQYPFTKNRKIAETLYADVLRQLSLVDRLSIEQLIENVRARANRDVSEALSPATFERIREQLKMQPS